MRTHSSIAALLFLVPPISSAPLAAAEGAVFRVTLATGARSEPARGRLLVFVVREGSEVPDRAEPVDGPFWDDPQPIFALDAALAPGASVRVDDGADAFPVPAGKLAPGRYRAQARYDLARENSDWRSEPGNLWSDVVSFEITSSGSLAEVALTLEHVVEAKPLPTVDGVEWFELRSALLSEFRGHDVFLHAGVVLPMDYDPKRHYPAQYEVPGFGGDHRGAAGGRRRRTAEGAAGELARAAFRIVLDPEGPNGHTLFADSANNGPCGAALVKELVPALEAKYPLIAAPRARVLRRHSSGGWSTLWLALTYPDVFGATWSTAPDPVDFRRFQKTDIYGQANFYTDESGRDLPSLRSDGAVKMTIRQEARGEDLLGPDNTSAQQWDSWFAVFGPRNARGNPAALFEPETGVIDRAMSATARTTSARSS
jgi:putative esterase